MINSDGNMVFAPANMLLHSANPALSPWAVGDTVVSSAGETAPSGVLASLLTEGVAGTATVAQAVTASVGRTVHTFEIKRGNHDWVRLRIDQSGNAVNQWVNLATLTLGGTVVSGVGLLFLPSVITDLGNGWARVTIYVQALPGSRLMMSLSADANNSGVRVPNGSRLIGQCSYENYSVSSPTGQAFVTGATAKYCERMDYNPQTLEKRGLLVESQSTNLLTVSDSPTVFQAISSIPPTPIMGWSGSLRMTGDGVLTNHQVFTSSGVVTGSTVYTFSVYVRYVNNQFIQLAVGPGVNSTVYANFDIINGTVTATSAGATASITPCSTGVFRIQMTFTSIASPSNSALGLMFLATSGTATRVPINTLTTSVDYFGFQFEAMGLATSLIPTYGVSATRSVDSTLITSLPWLTQNKGTWYFDVITNRMDGNNRRIFSLDDNTSNNRLQMGRSTPGSFTSVSSVAGVSDFAPSSSFTTDFTRTKVALKYNASGKTICAQGAAVSTSAVAPPTSGYTHLWLGHQQTYVPGNAPCGWLRAVRYYPDDTASNLQMQSLTDPFFF